MIQITNKQKHPVQILIRSKSNRGMACQNIPGIGSGHNVCYIEDERATEYIAKLEKDTGWIKTKFVPNNYKLEN